MSELPGWLRPNSNLLPPLYKKIWAAVQEDGTGQNIFRDELLVDTNKVFPLLLTSQLSTEVLGFIWNLANQKYAGQLTEQELYVTLALIALAQASYTFDSLNVLNLLRDPLCPNLNCTSLDDNFLREDQSSHTTLSAPDDQSDEFTEFQSAPAPNTTIGSRLANHNLGIKKINNQAKVTNCNKINNDKIEELFPKCHPKNNSKTILLKDTAIRNNNDEQNLMSLNSSEDKYSALRELEKSADSSTSDDFGDFVSANPLQCNSNVRDITDTLSTLSLEKNHCQKVLPRNSSEQSLDLNSFLPYPQDEEQYVDNIHQMIYWEWKQYMESCVFLLQVAANVFSSISSEMVLREVLSSSKGYNFLCNLAEVASVCRRVNFSHKEMDISIMGFDDLLMDIDRIWAEMEPFYSSIPIVTELPSWPSHPSDDVACALCLTVITSDRIVFNDYNYHASCANLWLFTVNNNLPALQYPSPALNAYIQSSISQDHV